MFQPFEVKNRTFIKQIVGEVWDLTHFYVEFKALLSNFVVMKTEKKGKKKI